MKRYLRSSIFTNARKHDRNILSNNVQINEIRTLTFLLKRALNKLNFHSEQWTLRVGEEEVNAQGATKRAKGDGIDTRWLIRVCT